MLLEVFNGGDATPAVLTLDIAMNKIKMETTDGAARSSRTGFVAKTKNLVTAPTLSTFVFLLCSLLF